MATTRRPNLPIGIPDRSVLVWLRRPEPLSRRRRRRQLAVLGLLALIGFARGAYWSVVTPVWSPIDEIAHFGYVQSIAEGHGVPVVGRDLISNQVLRSAKDSPTSVFRGQPFRPTAADPDWGPVRQQYEASAAPTYYALMVGPYWLGHPFGLAGEVLAIRLATVALALLAIPVTWCLARRLFPRHPTVWLLAPGLLVAANSFSFGGVTNDSLALVLAVAAVVALLRALDDRPAPGWVAGAGLVLGVGLVTKATILTIAPVLGAVVVMWWLAVRPTPRRVLRVGGTYGLAAVAPVVPWVVWNLVEYHALSASAAVDRSFGPTTRVLGWSALGSDLTNSRFGLFTNQLLRAGSLIGLWLALVVVATVAALVLARIRRAWDDLFGVALGVAALAASFVMLEMINATLEHGTGLPVGRHLLPVLPVVMTGAAGALGVVVTRRWLPAAAGVVVTLALLLESRASAELLQRAYLVAVPDRALVPVVDQGWADHQVTTPAVAVVPSCPVAGFSIGFVGPAPPELEVRSTGRSWTVPAVPVSTGQPLYEAPRTDSAWYHLPVPLAHPFTVALPADTAIEASVDERTPALALTGTPGDPVARLYCDGDDARAVAFRAAFDPGHPLHPSRRLLVAWPEALAGAAALATVALAWAAATEGRRRRPVRSGEPGEPGEPRR